MARNVFYSFHYVPDCMRASMVRNMSVLEGNRPATDNDWEKIVGGGDAAIKKWITDQMKGRSCCVVLAGSGTANRKWINHEIVEAWNKGMGVACIYVHGLKDPKNGTSAMGKNPLDYVSFNDGKKLSAIVPSHNPPGSNSKEKYAWIKNNFAFIVEEAIAIRKKN